MTFERDRDPRRASVFGTLLTDAATDAASDRADGFGGRGAVALDGFGARAPSDGFGGRPLQLAATGARVAGDPARVHDLATAATAGPAHALPHLETIQRAFGPHDVSGVRAHTDRPAQDGTRHLGAHGLATGNDVAFASPSPDLHTAAHEAAHVVQQRAGVHLADALGAPADAYERQADAVADAVVRGDSVADLLGPVTSTPAGSRVLQRKDNDAVGAGLLRSAASDLEALQARVSPLARVVPGQALDASELTRELTVLIRRVDEATAVGAASLRGREVENLAGALRALSSSLPPTLRNDPQVAEAVATLGAAIGDVATSTGVHPSAEPTVTERPLTDREQGQLARVLLGEASATLDEVSGLPPSADEHAQYARAAASSSSKLEVAADLIAAHVPPGRARMALTGTVEALSAKVALVDQWVRASKLSSDRSIGGLFRHERRLRELVGLEAPHRSPLEVLEVEATATALASEHPGSARAGTVAAVRAAFESTLDRFALSVSDFQSTVDTKDAPHPTLSDSLVVQAVELVLDKTLVGELKRALFAGARAFVGDQGKGGLPERLMNEVWKRGKAGLAQLGQHIPRKADLLTMYLQILRDGIVDTTDALRQGFEGQADQLASVAPDALNQLAVALGDQANVVRKEAFLEQILGWQNLKARNHQGTPEAPRFEDAEARTTPSERDAALSPAFAGAAPGVLHVDFPIVDLAPRTSRVRPGSGRIPDIAPAHLAALRGAQKRPLRELGLNTSIRVTYGDSNGGGVDLLWFPDGGAVKVGWERMDWARHPLRDARHLQAYARGVPTMHPELEDATEADAHEGARLIADAVASTLSDWALVGS